MKFYVNIVETLERTIIVEGCESEIEAEERAAELYNRERIVLDYDDFMGVEFCVDKSREKFNILEDRGLDTFDMEHDEPIEEIPF